MTRAVVDSVAALPTARAMRPPMPALRAAAQRRKQAARESHREGERNQNEQHRGEGRDRFHAELARDGAPDEHAPHDSQCESDTEDRGGNERSLPRRDAMDAPTGHTK